MSLLGRWRRTPTTMPGIPPTATGPPGRLAGYRVLVVDDDDELRRMLRTVLELDGALVSEADGVKAALSVAERVVCHVVLTDITMGHSRRDGVRLLDRVRASPRLAKIPVVAVTGCSALRAELTARGFDRVLIKPMDLLDLAPMILALVGGHDLSQPLDVPGAA